MVICIFNLKYNKIIIKTFIQNKNLIPNHDILFIKSLIKL